MKKTCDELVKHTFPGGKYDKSKSIFEIIEDVYHRYFNVFVCICLYLYLYVCPMNNGLICMNGCTVCISLKCV